VSHEPGDPADPAGGADDPTPVPLFGFGLAWGVFWLLLTSIETQDFIRQGGTALWKPLLWEGSSFVVATVIALWQWRRIARLDRLASAPWRWFAQALKWLPAIAPVFVCAVYAIRHAAYALAGLEYRHDPWPAVFAYEMLKFGAFWLMFVAIFFGIRSHAALAAARVRVQRERALAQQARLLQLAQQLEPHFLFNALNTIASTIHDDPGLAETLLTKLASLLRAATDLGGDAQTTLDEELRLLESYGAIVLARFGDRASLAFDVDPAARPCRVPAFVLQPLLENAFRHGVEAKPGPAAVVVSARVDGDRLRLAVDDDAGVLPADLVPGVGLANLRERLAARHGDRASLSVQARAGGGVAARVELPCVY